jgi:protein SCO1/2
LSDHDLIDALAEGDEKAFRYLVDTYKKGVFNTVLGFVQYMENAEELTQDMKKVSEAFAGDNQVLLISHSVAPWIDDVSTLKQYAADKKITNSNWHLVTGSKAGIYTIARTGYFADEATKSAITTQFLHTENFILVDKYGHIRGVYNGTIDFEVDNLVKHIKLLKQED